jgi:hypothetical protein
MHQTVEEFLAGGGQIQHVPEDHPLVSKKRPALKMSYQVTAQPVRTKRQSGRVPRRPTMDQQDRGFEPFVYQYGGAL